MLCPFCAQPISQPRVLPLGRGRFRYENGCPCLDHAVGVREADGSYYWESIVFSRPATAPVEARPFDTEQQTMVDDVVVASQSADEDEPAEQWFVQD